MNKISKSLLASAVFVLSAWSVSAVAQQVYTITDLGTPNGLIYSSGTGINDAGQVVGTSDYGATIWNGSVATQLDVSPTGTYAKAINDAGQVVGFKYFNGGATTAGIIWNGSTATELAPVGGIYSASSSAFAENNAGQEVGRSNSANNANGWVATIWNGTTPSALGSLGGIDSMADGINDSGQVVGFSTMSGTSPAYATLWNGTTPTDLGTLPGMFSYSSVATSINNAGTIVGYSYSTEGNSGGAVTQATLWNGLTATGLGTLGGASDASAINDQGEIVGQSQIATNSVAHATLWTTSGQLVDLNSEISPALASIVTLNDATAINDYGWIVADGTINNTGRSEAFLLQPAQPGAPPQTGIGGAGSAPEIDPASAASSIAFLFGGIAVLRGRRSAKLNRVAA